MDIETHVLKLHCIWCSTEFLKKVAVIYKKPLRCSHCNKYGLVKMIDVDNFEKEESKQE